MMASMAIAIGIDLGTTNSCAAVVIDGKPRVLAYPDGNKTIPSVFAIDKQGRALTGEEAKEQAALNPDGTVTASKRLIGRSFDSDAVQKMAQVFTYELAEGSESEVLVRVAGQVLTLEQISAAILMKIKENAELVLGQPVEQAVITVPAYFNDRQRQAVRAAGDLAGLDVLRVLNEPTAAALAYGLGRTLNQRVAIYDLGGGTFDISIIDIRDRIFEVIATGGDTFLGGVDFDDRVMQYLLGYFLDEHEVDLSYDRAAITRIRDAAEQAKIALSTEETHLIALEGIGTDDDGSPIDMLMELSRETLEELTGDLVTRSVNTVERIFHEAGTSRHQIDELLLVGGQSRMPLVRSQLESFLERPPSHKVHPDEAVAIGAAIMASSLERAARDVEFDPDTDVSLHDVLPVPIGIARPNGAVIPLFPKHQPLPATRTKRVTTSKKDQDTIVLRMVQGAEKRAQDCEMLGAFVFHGLRKGPAGKVRVEITFSIDIEGILDLSAVDADTGEPVERRIRLGRSQAQEEVPPAPLDMPLDALEQPSSEPDSPTPDDAPEPAKPEPASDEDSAPPKAEPDLPVDRPNDPLRAALRQSEPTPTKEEPTTSGGFMGWLRSLFGR